MVACMYFLPPSDAINIYPLYQIFCMIGIPLLTSWRFFLHIIWQQKLKLVAIYALHESTANHLPGHTSILWASSSAIRSLLMTSGHNTGPMQHEAHDNHYILAIITTTLTCSGRERLKGIRLLWPLYTNYKGTCTHNTES